MLVIVRRSLVSLSRQVGVGMIMWSRYWIVEVRCIIRSVRGVMLMLVFVWMLVCVSVRMAVHHVAVGMGVVMNVLVRMDVFMRVRLNRLVDLGHPVPPSGGVIANPGRMTGGRFWPLLPAGPPFVAKATYRQEKFTSMQWIRTWLPSASCVSTNCSWAATWSS